MALAFGAHLNRASAVCPDGARALALAQPLPLQGGSVAWRTTRPLALLSGAWIAAVAQKCKPRRAQRQQGIARAAVRPEKIFESDEKRGNEKTVLDFETLFRMAEFANAAEQQMLAIQNEIERQVDAGFSTWTWAQQQQLHSALFEPDNLPASRMLYANILAAERRKEPATEALQDIMDRAFIDDETKIQEIVTTVMKAESPFPYLLAMEKARDHYKETGMVLEEQNLERVRLAVVEELDMKTNPMSVPVSRVVAEEDGCERDTMLRKLLEPGDSTSIDSKEKLPSLVAASFTYIVEKLVLDGNAEETKRNEAVEQLWRVAEEARLVIGEHYGEAKLKQFSADLSAAFKTHRGWQKKRQQDQQRQQEEQAAAAAAAVKRLLRWSRACC